MEPLDLDAYLARIGFSGKPSTDLASLHHKLEQPGDVAGIRVCRVADDAQRRAQGRAAFGASPAAPCWAF